MKNARQAMILEIIAGQAVETQEQLLELLRLRGIHATQATISRDIRQLHLVKASAGGGTHKYTLSTPVGPKDAPEKLRTIFRESILSIDCAQNLVIIKTMPGLADGACLALDHMDLPDMVGSLAGDDTAFLAMRDTESAAAFCRAIREIL